MHRLHTNHRLRNSLITLVTTLVVGAVGLAAAAWLTVPRGSGSVYGKGAAATGVAITSLDYRSGVATTIGPNQAGTAYLKLHNSNTFPVNVTFIGPTDGATITSVDDAACTSTAFTLDTTHTSPVETIPAGSDDAGTLTLNLTTGNIPVCLSGHVFTIGVDLVGTPA